VDPERHVTTIDGKPVELTLTEFGMLHFLALRPGFVRTRDQIITAVHGRNVVLSSRTVDVHMTALRRKMGDLGALIETVRGVGYRFAEGDAASVE
jgi:two-component system phosphate regulon response regulator PhoB